MPPQSLFVCNPHPSSISHAHTHYNYTHSTHSLAAQLRSKASPPGKTSRSHFQVRRKPKLRGANSMEWDRIEIVHMQSLQNLGYVERTKSRICSTYEIAHMQQEWRKSGKRSAIHQKYIILKLKIEFFRSLTGKKRTETYRPPSHW